MGKFKLRNDNDLNDVIELRAEKKEEALKEGLEKLGWNLLENK